MLSISSCACRPSVLDLHSGEAASSYPSHGMGWGTYSAPYVSRPVGGLLSLWPTWPLWQHMLRPWMFHDRLWLLNLGMKCGCHFKPVSSPFIPMAVFVNTRAENLELSRGFLSVGEAVCHVQFTASLSCPVTLPGCRLLTWRNHV